MCYTNTFIKIAEDCPVDKSEIPVSNREQKPAHIIQYELLMKSPYQFGHEDLIYEVYITQKEIPQNISAKEAAQIKKELFAKGHPCLRASALTKRYGFGAHYNQNGKIAIYPIESEQYEMFVNDPAVKKLPAMKSKR